MREWCFNGFTSKFIKCVSCYIPFLFDLQELFSAGGAAHRRGLQRLDALTARYIDGWA